MQAFHFNTPNDKAASNYSYSSFSSGLKFAVRRVAVVLGLATMVSQPAALAMSIHVSQALPSTGAPAYSQYFAPTGKSVGGQFLTTFNRFGLAQIGYPLSDERQESGRTVQYFERVRMEYHPDLASKGYGVLMTRLGVDLSGNPFSPVSAFQPNRTSAYFRATGHSLAEPFLSYWKSHGSVELFGYPISEPLVQDGLKVQWFERARFEYHPELAKNGQAVQLSLLGRTAYEKYVGKLTVPQVQLATQLDTKQPPAEAPKPAPQVALSGMENYLLQAINQQRAAAGLGQVKLSVAVTDLSRARSQDMAERNYFSHTTPEGNKFLNMLVDRGVSYKFAGEILARNNYPDEQAAQVAMQSYLDSAPHKAIIMDGRYTDVGIGYAKSGEDGMHYFTVIFVQQ
jgi:uncharacterized protein YkwD